MCVLFKAQQLLVLRTLTMNPALVTTLCKEKHRCSRLRLALVSASGYKPNCLGGSRIATIRLCTAPLFSLFKHAFKLAYEVVNLHMTSYIFNFD